jgi:hypothetical protein
MSFKGTSGKSASGASMSKYDVEVEGRLQALEKAVADLGAKCDARASGGGGDSERLESLIKEVKKSIKINL